MWPCHSSPFSGIVLFLLIGSAVIGSTRQEFGTKQYPVDRHKPLQISVAQSTSTSLKRRVAFPPILIGDWIFDHHDFTCLLPISSAATELREFYENVVGFAAITEELPLNHFALSMGEIKLEVIGAAGTVIPWIVVQNFANRLLKMTNRGYTNSYQINFIHKITGSLVTFNLYVGYIRALQE